MAGTWVVGPYPLDPANPDADIARSLPPESNPDASQPVAGSDGKGSLVWKRVMPAAGGQLDLAPIVQPSDSVCAYVMSRVYAPEDSDAVALVSSDGRLRFWTNGDLMMSQPLALDYPVPMVIHLRAGWNTLLAKVSNREAGFSSKFKLTSDLMEIARAFVSWTDKNGESDHAAARLERLYTLVPDRHGALDNHAELLAAEVARRDIVFHRVIASRPKDSLLWQERARYLAGLGKWDEALAAYEAMIQNRLH